MLKKPPANSLRAHAASVSGTPTPMHTHAQQGPLPPPPANALAPPGAKLMGRPSLLKAGSSGGVPYVAAGPPSPGSRIASPPPPVGHSSEWRPRVTYDVDPDELYVLIEELAVGCYGTVYRAETKAERAPLAMKIIALQKEDNVKETLQEVRGWMGGIGLCIGGIFYFFPGFL